MKRLGSLLLIIAMIFSLTACAGQNEVIPEAVQDTTRASAEAAPPTNSLVVYFSMPDNLDDSTVTIDGEVLGNTQYMAYVIGENANADIFRIIPKNAYPTDHGELIDLAKDEQNENARPEIDGEIDNMADYDTVFVGYPNWWGDMPMILYTFFDSYDLSDKTIVPFNTHGGSGFSSTVDTIKELEPNAKVEDGLSISRDDIEDAEQEIVSWLKTLGFEKSDEANSTVESTSQAETESVTEAVATTVLTTAKVQSNNKTAAVKTTAKKAKATAAKTKKTTAKSGGKTLVAYFSWSGNTGTMANTIAKRTNGTIFEIVPVNAYPTDYDECTDVALEERDENARPRIKNLPKNLNGYDRVFIGYPIWWHTAPMIIGTFLESYNLNGVDVYPFTQSASMDEEQFENSMDFVRDCAKNATVHDGLFADSDDTSAIAKYISQIA